MMFFYQAHDRHSLRASLIIVAKIYSETSVTLYFNYYLFYTHSNKLSIFLFILLSS